MIATLTSSEITDAEGNVLRACDSLDIWGCEARGISTVTESHTVSGSKHRTLENAIRRDVTGTYRTITIGYELLDYSRFEKIRDMWKTQCDGLACLTLVLTNPCEDAECGCHNFGDKDEIVGTLDIGEASWETNGRWVTGFSFSFEESNPCDTCNTCGD